MMAGLTEMGLQLLAPTVEQATPKIEKFARRIPRYLGRCAELMSVGTCDPDTREVVAPWAGQWIEGLWIVEIEADSVSFELLRDVDKLSNAIDLNDVDIIPVIDDNGQPLVRLKVYLSARVLR